MTFSFAQLLTSIFAYLSILFGIGYMADHGLIPRRIITHPVVYVLSLGVVAGALATYGAVELAFQYGYSFLLYYFGITLMFMLSPLLLHPLLRLSRIHQLSSLADIITFRFRSPSVGALVTLVMLAAMLPLLALQIQAVSDVIHILSGGHDPLTAATHQGRGLAFLFCILITVFAISFGSSQLTSRQRHDGLVAAIAFESLVKLCALMVIGLWAIHAVFGGFSGLETWLNSNPHLLDLLESPLRQDSARALLLIFFAGAVAMPHIFHMAFTENPGSGALRAASWGLPAYLFLISLPILPITWAALELDSDLPQAYSALAIGMQTGSSGLTAIAFLAGMSAASAVIIVSTLALANMCLNHLVLPLLLRGPTSSRLSDESDIYEQLRWLRRLLITAIILAGYLFFSLLGPGRSLSDLGLAAFVGTLQFLPAILATIYWPGANRWGLIAGLLAGFLTWYFTLLLPLVSEFDPQFFSYLYLAWFDDVESLWSAAAISSLGINICLFVLVSMITPTTENEAVAAEICCMDDLNRPIRQTLSLQNPDAFKNKLAEILGEGTAKAEVDRALSELRLPENESRPYALRRLRARIEANLSGLLGPAVAFKIMQSCVPYQLNTPGGSEDISLIERRLDNAQVHFTGLAADLDNLRRYHRETLRNLPIGVFSLGRDGEVLTWNRAMEETTGVLADEVVGSYLSSLPPAWSTTLGAFVSSSRKAEPRLNLTEPPATERWISLHKAAVESSSRVSEDQVIVVEDLTNYQMLEQELMHSERLASIGRLAAGMAHEIGNPVTGIACLAQNLEYEADIDAVQETAQDILKQTDRVTRIVESLVNFSHIGKNVTGTLELGAVNLADCVDEAIHLLQLDHSAKQVRFINYCDREHLVLADSQSLLQVFINLLSNARDASSVQGLVEIDSEALGEQVISRVTDYGEGIMEHIQGQVFEPFFTTKEPGEGTGLGLSLVYNILEKQGGRIGLQSPLETSAGTRFSVTLAAASYSEEYH
jgi:PAS domain S-box-containing protein